MIAPVAGWENFFVAEVGAAAALIGLLFVAVSINLKRILEIQHLPGRAAETLLNLFTVLAIATCGLVPRQTQALFGAEVLGTALLIWSATLLTQLRAYRDPVARKWLRLRVVTMQCASLPFVVAGVSLVCGMKSGMFWIVPGTLASFGAGVLNAWVLLIEIHR